MEKEIMFNILESSSYIKRLFTKKLDQIDISYPQWCVLKALKESDGASASILCEVTKTDKATMSEILKKLDQKGFISKEASSSDKRASVIKISDSAMSLCNSVRKIEDDVVNIVFKKIKKEDLNKFNSLLKEINNNVLEELK